MAKDDIDFDAYMRDRGVPRTGTPGGGARQAAINALSLIHI